MKRNKLFFYSYYGSQYGGNPKYITRYILDHYSEETFDIVWAFNKIQTKQYLKGIKKVKRMSLKYFYHLCTAKVVVTNFRTMEWFVKRSEQYYIQTWHSSLRLKQIEKDAVASLPEHYINMAKKDSKKCDLLLSGCRYSTDIFKRVFWYDGEIFEHGTPRNDVFFQKHVQLKKDILNSLHKPGDSKVILYAPTFRKDNKLTVYNLDYQRITEKMTEKFGGKWLFLVKLHPHLISVADSMVEQDNVLNVTGYDDIQELLSISDILISDYSSLMFDFSLTRRPCFLYVPDIQEYIQNERKLYFDLDDLPFISTESNEDLLNKIETFDSERYKRNLLSFLEDTGSFEDGQASKHLMDRIEQVCFGKKNKGDMYEAV